jgi:hypothetical protein
VDAALAALPSRLKSNLLHFQYAAVAGTYTFRRAIFISTPNRLAKILYANRVQFDSSLFHKPAALRPINSAG